MMIGMLCAAAAMTAGFNGIQQVLVPGRIEALDPAGKVATLAVLTTLAALASMIGIPLGGALSDRTRTRFGKRTPWIVALSGLSAVLMMLMSDGNDLITLGLAYASLWLILNMYQGALVAILPDRVPEDRRGLASAVIGLGTPLGALIGVNTASHVGAGTSYIALAVLLVAASLALVLLAPEASSRTAAVGVPETARPDRHLLGFFDAFRSRDFALAFASRFLLCLSYFTVSGYLYYTLSDHIGIDQIPDRNVPVAVSTLLSISVLAWVGIAAFCGWLADRIDRRKLFVGISAVGLGATMFVPILSPDWNGMIIYSALAGAFIGIYFAVDLAVMSLVLPDPKRVGRDFGILAVATGLPQIMSAALAGALIDHAGGYNALYLFGACCAAVAGVTALFIRKVR
ncbi:SLC45 family MFS transporter [Solimonas terrae]|uniref:SLC45 family MFS transporter n=1 Tax=Solimonas terrae TaxID=1396819 RepID=A0A6M2BK12_9GAMM|nr:SLC45 family MFS transporter [Solimonas terrae]